jgi:hypothetical protein
MTPSERLALVREAEEARALLYRGGLTPAHRAALEARVTEIVKTQIDEEDAEAATSRPAPSPLPEAVLALTPEAALAKADELMKQPAYFSMRGGREVEDLRAEVAALHRRAFVSDEGGGV